MLNLLFLFASAYASDVYEICKTERQYWSERYQEWRFEYIETFSGYDNIQLIKHKSNFEFNTYKNIRDKHPIVSESIKDGNQCWKEHINSEICYNKELQVMFWEKNQRSGDVIRDILYVCLINGE